MIIELRGLRFDAICGVLDVERTTPQPLELDVDLQADLDAAGESDDLADTVDYGGACAAIEQVVTTLRPQLLERMASAVADALLALDGRVDAVTVTVRKLDPPVPQVLATSGVTVLRGR